MKLDRHEVCGFFHFDRPFILDVRTLEPGVIAITGPNGAGKTSLGLDAPLAGVYGPGLVPVSKIGAFPSRAGTLADYATSPAAYIDDLWTIEGKGQYRIRVNVDGIKRVADAVIQAVPGGPLNDGKVSTFRDAIRELFPSRQSVLASAFAAQTKRGSFNELGQKERMELFVELADLAHYEQRSQAAARCAKVAEGIAARLRAALEVLRREVTPETIAALETRQREIAAETHEATTHRDVAAGRVTALEAERPRAAEEAERHAVATARIAEVTAALAAATGEQDRIVREITAQPEAERIELAKVEARHTGGLASLDARRRTTEERQRVTAADRAERIERNRQLLTEAETIRAAATTVQEASARIHTERERQTECGRLRTAALDQVTSRERKLDALTAAERTLAGTRTRAALLDRVKFGAECGVEPACPLVTDAVSARETIPALEAEVAHRPTLEEGIAHWRSVADANAEALRASQDAILADERGIAQAAPQARLEPHLGLAEGRIAEYERDGAEAVRVHTAFIADLDRERMALDETRTREQAEVKAAATARLTELDAHRDDIVRRRASLAETLTAAQQMQAATADAKRRLAAIDDELRNRRAAVAFGDTTLAAMAVEAAEVTRRLAQATSHRGTIAEAERRLRTVEDEGLAWATLARACGRDGLQRLEIDAAGPVVSDLANQLLRVGWGARFSIDIVTQVATADGTATKEKFTILVTDNDHAGEARDIGDLSGGEGVVVNEAVRAALSCYVNLRSRRPCRTIWRDEADGALHAESGPRYVAMLRKLRELSGAEHLFFITHRPESMALADAQVRVLDGQATVALPPYAEIV